MSVEKTIQNQAIEIVSAKETEQLKYRSQLDFKALGQRKQMNEIIKYTSVPVIFSTTRNSFKGSKRKIVLKGDFVLLEITGGQHYIPSTKEVDLFIL